MDFENVEGPLLRIVAGLLLTLLNLSALGRRIAYGFLWFFGFFYWGLLRSRRVLSLFRTSIHEFVRLLPKMRLSGCSLIVFSVSVCAVWDGSADSVLVARRATNWPILQLCSERQARTNPTRQENRPPITEKRAGRAHHERNFRFQLSEKSLAAQLLAAVSANPGLASHAKRVPRAFRVARRAF